MAVKTPSTRPAAKQPRIPRSAKTPRPKPPRRNERFWHDVLGVCVVLFSALLLASLIYGSKAGLLGSAMAMAARYLLGAGAYALPPVCLVVGILLITGKERETRAHFVGGTIVSLLLFVSFWQIAHTTRLNQFDDIPAYGGIVGAGIVWALRNLFNDLCSNLILSAVGVVTLVWALDMRLLHLFGHAANAGKKISAPVARTAKAAHETAVEMRSIRAAEKERIMQDRALEEKAARELAAKERAARIKSIQQEDDPFDAEPETVRSPLALRSLKKDTEQKEVDPPTVKQLWTPEAPTLKIVSAEDPMPARLDLPAVPAMEHSGQSGGTASVQLPLALAEDGTPYKFDLPPVTLLKESPARPPRSEAASLEKQAVLMQTLNDFKIGANVSQVAVGPTVTRYEVQLEPGILVRKIVSLADNLAMSLADIDVRVEAPIPGKSAIGIEVPNDVVQLVSLRECIDTPEFMAAPSKLTFALGKDVSGNFRYADLTRMPHLLVGGSTNSGKSVCLNVLISSILYRATPREVKFVMIDPKRVELSLYDGIPHLMAPVIKNVKQAAGIFRSVLKEMEERYDRFAQIGTRNIDGFNNRVPPEERLPFIVVVVDELADLMMQQGPEVETSICRIAQLARATGIHLVIATQRPSVDVITGTIKANISSRIAFAVATSIDSRTIIDQPGADRLIGRGDMLYLPIDASKPLRVQGCYIGERETESLVKYLREQEDPVYTMIPSETSASGMDSGSEYEEIDDLFEPCVRWLVLQGQCSTSSLQRKFKIGYTRAARLVENMEARQIVGPQDGVKPREILLTADRVNEYFAGYQQGDLGQG